LWERYPALFYGTVRSASYLRWRYLDHPTFRYVVVAAGSSEEPAIAAYRIETAAGSDVPVGRVIEFFHSGSPAGRAAGVTLAREVACRFQAAGCAFADFVASSADFGVTFERAGWVSERGGQPLLPSRLQPVERTALILNLEVGTHAGMARPALGDLHVTRGDGDADRPVTA
jgi:hypothetical protein